MSARSSAMDESNQGWRSQGTMQLRRWPSSSVASASTDVSDDKVDLRKLAACTTVYSLLEGIITYPYDVVKTRQQVSPPGSAVTQMSTIEYVHKVIQTNGPRSLYRGFSWNVLGGVPSEVAYYAAYTHAKELMLSDPLGQQHPSAVFFLSGLVSDIVSVVLWVPADIVSQRLQVRGARCALTSECASSRHGSDGGAAGSRLFPALTHLKMLSSQLDATSTELGRGASSALSHGCASQPDVICKQTIHSVRSCSAASTIESAESTGLEIVASIIRTEGILGLWRGTWITMASLAYLYCDIECPCRFGQSSPTCSLPTRFFPMCVYRCGRPSSAVWWLTHEQMKKRIARDMDTSEENVGVLTGISLLAGTVLPSWMLNAGIFVIVRSESSRYCRSQRLDPLQQLCQLLRRCHLTWSRRVYSVTRSPRQSCRC